MCDSGEVEDPEYLAELESRLYSQVFHSTAECENDPASLIVEPNLTVAPKNLRRYRYFGPEQGNSLNRTFIPFSKEREDCSYPAIENNITIYPDSASFDNGGEIPGIIQNNITVNQYNIPILYHSQQSQVSRSKNNSLLVFQQRRQRRKEKRVRKKQMKRSTNIRSLHTPEEVICLSDDSNDDCIVIPEDNCKDEDESKNDSDGDIIYIPPPPPVVINIDVEEILDKPSHESSPKDNWKSPESTVANDFLDNNSVDNSSRFNFGLHGADFNSQNNDFVRPTVPAEYCETESSCSTNDQSRDFNNSVKTIVFDEVEFPREDIFSEKNLESFKTFITPQRKSDINVQKNKSGKKTSGKTSSDSSSESDYDVPKHKKFEDIGSNKNLPTLSLMQPQEGNSKQTAAETETLETTEDLNSVNSRKQTVAEASKDVKKLKKKRTKSTEPDPYVDDGGKSNTSAVSQDNQNDNKANPCTEEHDNIPHLHNIKRKRNCAEVQYKGNFPENTSTPKTKKKHADKVETTVDSCQEQLSALEDSFLAQMFVLDSVDVEENKSAKKKKKKKSCSEKSNHDTTVETSHINVSQDISLTKNLIVVDDAFADIEVVDSDSNSPLQEGAGNDLQLANIVSESQSQIFPRNNLFLDRKFVDTTNFDLEKIRRQQRDDPELWQISYKDRATYLNRLPSRGPRCNRCRQLGHSATKCTEKSGPPPCYLCGGYDHQEPRCPNKVCTQCATPGAYSTTYCWNCFKFRHIVCYICGLKGHLEKTCPDLWRRYHLTTEKGPIVVAKDPQLKPKNQRWCSGCGKQGHLEHECNFYQRTYPPTLPYIVTYGDLSNPMNNNNCSPAQNNAESSDAEQTNVPQTDPYVVDPSCTSLLRPSYLVQNQATLTLSAPQTHANVVDPSCNSLLRPYILPGSSVTKEAAPQIHTNVVDPSCTSLLRPSYLMQSPAVTAQPIPNIIDPNCMSLLRPPYLMQALAGTIQPATQTHSNVVDPSCTSLLQPPYLLQGQGVSTLPTPIISISQPVKVSTMYMPNPLYNPLANQKKLLSGLQNTPPAISKDINTKTISVNQHHFKSVERFMTTQPEFKVRKFLKRQMAELDNNCPNQRPKNLQRIMNAIEMKAATTAKSRHKLLKVGYRPLNMFIFGYHKLLDGNRHLDCMRQFLSQKNVLEEYQRRSLLNAYWYIFGTKKHSSINYSKILQKLDQVCSNK